MSGAAATVVWIAPADAPPPVAARTLLEGWARAHGVTLRTPREPSSDAAAAGDSARAEQRAVAARVEADLSAARDALARLDADAVDHALLDAGARLRAHPELPEAAWLLAEVERAWAARWTRAEPRDADRAEAALARASALDRGRAAGVGEPAKTSASPPEVPVRVDVDAGGRELLVFLDGRPEPAHGVAAVVPGEHQLLVTTARDGRVAYAAWVGVAPGTTIALELGPPPPCSADDLAPDHRAHAACTSWIAVRAASNDAIAIATCAGATCGPELEWRRGALRGGSGAPVRPAPDAHARDVAASRGAGIPRWLGWTLAGAGAVALGVGALWLGGAFSSTEHETRFVVGGVKPASR